MRGQKQTLGGVCLKPLIGNEGGQVPCGHAPGDGPNSRSPASCIPTTCPRCRSQTRRPARCAALDAALQGAQTSAERLRDALRRDQRTADPRPAQLPPPARQRAEERARPGDHRRPPVGQDDGPGPAALRLRPSRRPPRTRLGRTLQRDRPALRATRADRQALRRSDSPEDRERPAQGRNLERKREDSRTGRTVRPVEPQGRFGIPHRHRCVLCRFRRAPRRGRALPASRPAPPRRRARRCQGQLHNPHLWYFLPDTGAVWNAGEASARIVALLHR